MRKISLIIILCSFIACKNSVSYELPFYSTADFTPNWYSKNDAALQNIHTIPAFSFTDQNGNSITDKTVADKIYVADFFFTRCAGICPKMTSNMKRVADAFQTDNSVFFLSHSVTPEYDSISVLKKYANEKKILNPNWHLLTGDKEQIYALARTGYFAEMKDGYSKTSNEFLHTENFLLIDKHGRIRGIYNGTLEVEINDLIDHIRMLQKED